MNKLIRLPSRVIPKKSGAKGAPPSEQVDAVHVLRQLVLSLPFWRVGRDVKRLDAQAAVADELDRIEKLTPDRYVMCLSAGQQELLSEAMEAPGATIPDQEVNRLYSEVLRAVLVAEDGKMPLPIDSREQGASAS